MPDNAKYFTTLRGAFHLLTTFSIPVALVALTLEIDGDVTERGGLRLGTPNQLSQRCPFLFFFQFIVDFLLGLHASLTVSSFQDVPKASVGDDPPAIEQIVAIAPIACRDSGDDLCCLRFLKTLTK